MVPAFYRRPTLALAFPVSLLYGNLQVSAKMTVTETVTVTEFVHVTRQTCTCTLTWNILQLGMNAIGGG